MSSSLELSDGERHMVYPITVTSHLRLGGSNIRNVRSPRSGGRKSEIKVWAGLGSSEAVREDLPRPLPSVWGLPASLAFLRTAVDHPDLCLHLHGVACVSLCVKLPLGVRTALLLDQGPPYWSRLNLILCKEPISKQGHVHRYCGWDCDIFYGGRDSTQHHCPRPARSTPGQTASSLA